MTWPCSRHHRPASPLLLALALGLGACGGGGDGALPSVSILQPSAAATHDTTAAEVRVGGGVTGAAFVHVINTTTGAQVEADVSYVSGQGSWFADVYGLIPGANRIVATADADGGGARTAVDVLTVNRPLQPASLILNGADALTASSHWVDASSFGASHRIELHADGTGQSTTGHVLSEPAGVPVIMSWAYDGAEAIVVIGCPACSFQRISRIAGSTAERAFRGQVATVGGAGETASHAFQLGTGTL